MDNEIRTKEDIYNNAKNKSLKKGIPIKYKGQIIKLDPLKVAIASFGLTASLVVAGIATSKLVQHIKKEVKEVSDIMEYRSDVMKNWDDNGDIYRVNENKHYAIDYVDIASDILSDTNTRDAKLFVFLGRSGENSNEFKELLTTLAYIEGENYQTLEEYVKVKGFNSIKEWNEFCKETILKESNGRTM